MATNWNTILSNTKNLNDVLAILRKILGQTDKLSELDIDGILANIDAQVNQATSNFDSKQVDALNQLKETLEVAKAAGAGANGWITDIVATKITDAATQDLFNQKGVTTVESVADLAGLDVWDGRTVNVKSYIKGLGKGGGTFIYDSSKANLNDQVFVINGWVRQVSDNTYSPYMAGCLCDGSTDDALNLDKLMYALESNNIIGEVVFDQKTLINTAIPQTGKLTNNLGEKVGVRLVDNVSLNIPKDASIIFGKVFDDCNTSLISANYRADDKDYYGWGLRYNIKIYGGGTIDCSQSGGFKTQYWGNRYVIHFGSTQSAELSGVTITGGAFSNVVCSAIKGSKHRYFNNHFIDTFTDAPANNADHSTIYCLAENTRVYDNTFEMTSISAKAIACSCELHNSDQQYFRNTVKGYWSGVYLTAEKKAWEHASGDTVWGQQVYNNNAYTTTRFCWLDTSDDVKTSGYTVHDNNHYLIPYPSDDDLKSIGRQPYAYRVTSFMSFMSSTSSVSNWIYGSDDRIDIYSNKHICIAQPNAYQQVFLSQDAIVGNNLKVHDNSSNAPKIAFFANIDKTNSAYYINGFELTGNTFDESKFTTDSQMGVNAYSLQAIVVNISLNPNLIHDATSTSFMYFSIQNGDTSKNNTIQIYTSQPEKRTGWWMEWYSVTGADIAVTSQNSKLSYPVMLPCKSYTANNGLVLYSTDGKTKGLPFGDILNMNWFDKTTSSQFFINKTMTKEYRTGDAAALSTYWPAGSSDISALASSYTIPVQVHN